MAASILEVAAGNMGDAFNYVIFIVIISFIAIFIMIYVSIRMKGSEIIWEYVMSNELLKVNSKET